jgi:hypothetical protein
MKGFLFFLLGGVGLFALIAISFYCWNPPIPSADPWVLKANIGQAFGVVSAAFGAFAFAAALCTVYLQQKQLNLQRKEIEESHAQLERTMKAQEQSVSMLREQALLIALSARLNALLCRVEYDLKITEIEIRNSPGKTVSNLSPPHELWNQIGQIEERLKRLSEWHGRPPNAPTAC